MKTIIKTLKLIGSIIVGTLIIISTIIFTFAVLFAKVFSGKSFKYYADLCKEEIDKITETLNQ